jgi:hypothetical protein
MNSLFPKLIAEQDPLSEGEREAGRRVIASYFIGDPQEFEISGPHFMGLGYASPFDSWMKVCWNRFLGKAQELLVAIKGSSGLIKK